MQPTEFKGGVIGVPPMHRFLPCGIFAFALTGAASAQDRQVFFDTSAAGVSKTAEWGLDTAWHDVNNMRRGSVFMGADNVDTVRVSFTPDFAVVNGELQAGPPTDYVNRSVDWVNSWANANTTLYLNESRALYEEMDPSYRLGNGQINPVTWAELMDVTTREYQELGRTVVSVAPVNEVDNRWADCTPQTHFDILGEALQYPRLDALRLGVCTLNTDVGLDPWYNYNQSRLDEGVTHQLAGSFDNYANYFQTVRANGDHASNDELHNIMEAIVGVEYGMQTGIWWGTAELARGEFVKASKGERIGYAEDRPKWSAAAVYRAPDGKVQAFVGESERQSIAGIYQFVARDRNVYFDGHGPQRTYTVQTSGDATYGSPAHKGIEKVVNVTWGEDVQPAIGGRYILVARHSGKVMEVAGAGTGNGDNIQQNTYTGGLHQQWDITALPYDNGGDNSYYSITAAHSGSAADVYGFSLNDGGDIRQWDGGTGINQVYFLEYVEDGWFRIRNRWSGKHLDVAGVSIADGANIHQWEGTGGANQQWRLIPASVSNYDFVAPAAPSGLVTTANDVSVTLSWNANGESDLNGYHVYRSLTPGGPYEIIARNVPTNSYVDGTASKAITCYYKIKAVDQSLNRSGYSTEVSATPAGGNALVAHYDFESDLLDQSGNGNDGTIVGTEFYAAGHVDLDSLVFDGTNHVLLPPEVGDHDQLTIACWVYWNGGADWQRIFDFGNGIDEFLFLTPKAAGAGLRFAMRDGGPEQQLNTTALPVGQWTHVAVTLGAGSAQLYVNGALADSQTTTIKPSDFSPILNYLGKSQWPDPLLAGRLDDVRIYNHALSGAEVASLVGGTWTELAFDDFEAGLGNYTDGGGDCSRSLSGYSPQGMWSMDIQDNSGTASSFWLTNGIDVATPGYTQIQVDFSFRAVSMENGEDFFVQYFNGSTWQTVATYVRPTHFANGTVYDASVLIEESSHTFPTNMRIRFMCDASDNNDDVYIDEIRISAK